jgi:hypothetical protein
MTSTAKPEAFCGRRLKSAIRRAEPISLQRLNRTQRSAQAGCNGWRRQRTTSSVIRSVAVSFRRRQRRARRDSVSVHPAVHIRRFVTRPSWTSPRELVSSRGISFTLSKLFTLLGESAAPGNLFLVFLWLPQGSLILHSFFTTVRGFCVAVRDDLAESGCMET